MKKIVFSITSITILAVTYAYGLQTSLESKVLEAPATGVVVEKTAANDPTQESGKPVHLTKQEFLEKVRI